MTLRTKLRERKGAREKVRKMSERNSEKERVSESP